MDQWVKILYDPWSLWPSFIVPSSDKIYNSFVITETSVEKDIRHTMWRKCKLYTYTLHDTIIIHNRIECYSGTKDTIFDTVVLMQQSEKLS